MKISSFSYGTEKRNETLMAANIAAKGPMSVCVATNGWQTYTSGILKSGCGGAADVDHCVQTVGYNDEGATPYWIVRNSWNTGTASRPFELCSPRCCRVCAGLSLLVPTSSLSLGVNLGSDAWCSVFC